MKTSRSPEPSGSPLGSLIAQWRAEADKLQKVLEGDPNDEGASNAHGQLVMCIEELVDALKPLADLEAEMRRFAEPRTGRLYTEVGRQALAWAETLKGVRG